MKKTPKGVESTKSVQQEYRTKPKVRAGDPDVNMKGKALKKKMDC